MNPYILILFVFLSTSLFSAEENSQYSAHKQSYLIAGKPDIKFLASVKYRLHRKWPVYFAYTQLTFWEGGNNSHPLTEINFSPELFYQRNQKLGVFNSMRIGFYEHLSNGKDGAESKSYDRFYLYFAKNSTGNHAISFFMKAYYYYAVNKKNKLIKKHLGLLKTGLTWSDFLGKWIKREKLKIEVTWGGKYSQQPKYGSQQFTFEAGLPWFFSEFLSAYVQYYHGYVETLSQFDEKTSALRAGIAASY